jgi:lauroyl/myristoyl acyltransferase
MEKIKMGYCPTMTKFANTVSENVREIEAIPASSAAEVLGMLYYGQLDVALIGRSAKKSEISKDTNEYRLMSGVTLIYKMKSGISLDQLANVEVLTYLPDEKITDVKDFFGKVVKLNSLEDCLKYKLEVPVIIDWKDFRDEFELLIPVTNQGKAPQFRAPVLYYKNINSEILDKIKKSL